MHHIHTDEDITITFKRDGRYDEAALEKLNWFLRDWRKGEQTNMDPHLIDLAWEVQREVGAKEPIWVVCGYRSPATNAMLRRNTSGVAKFSQHMLGHALDFYIPGVPLDQLRAIGLRLQRGGVGFYPTSGSPFVHMDTAAIRMWPRMSRQELMKVFPDGRTVHLPADGKPLPGYALALADIRKRGSEPSTNSLEAARAAGVNVGPIVAGNESSHTGAFAKLLGFGKNAAKTDDEDDDSDSPAPAKAASDATHSHLKPAIVASFEHAASKTASAAAKTADTAVKTADNAVKTAEAAAKSAEAGVKTAETAVVKTAEAAAAKTVAAARVAVAAAPKLVRTAAASERTAPAVAPTTAQTPNEVILSRGVWEGMPDEGSAENSAPAVPAATLPRRTEVASADPDATAALSPWANEPKDRAASGMALAYANEETPAGRTVTGIVGQSGTTIVSKGMIDRPRAAVQKALQVASTTLKAGVVHMENPWLRAVVLSPSVHNFLSTIALGARDFKALAALMVKPSSVVAMTFSSDPNLGLTHDRFTAGSALVFVPTITYQTKTASLQ